ncbi:tRNA (adenosine(37)-N6)-threonylcarbamoyltransferase complex dimerization subunit type 1 TsaB [Lutibacter sp.]|uniref:tRNA (adenosine(37)-N6)-threonylcarbamoyltransferase complex dimerization subunit type 1 TsaB n=1 Tax=Lutibacter sp. TaxID=1925666 RepID=UPI0027372D07|nr:tRNA (adenosine(37)-N6)-threonylcarbamoyltransferase complex dimerization subunit type 1 TsaB [Lutibacter sp.]MDP3313110.1 tRNA (adenosine(37)-N6)-threonylcarbamoyltransferase complex dimerization subunit type 1 TsaB [Lutibacter sp.]
MAIILNLETSTKNCSVSIAKDGVTVALKELNDGGFSHAEKLHEFIKKVLTDASLTFSDLSAVAVSKGPGSYTGLRIGVSAAKGLCFALNIPLISIHTLKSLAHSMYVAEGFKIPLLDARRMEVYCAVFDETNFIKEDVAAKIVTSESFKKYLDLGNVYFLGDGVEKCKTIITHKNAHFIEDKFPSAKEMELLSFEKYKTSSFENVAYFEPFYLKDFMVNKPKK